MQTGVTAMREQFQSLNRAYKRSHYSRTLELSNKDPRKRQRKLQYLLLPHVALCQEDDNPRNASWKGETHEATPTGHPSGSENHLCRSLEVGTGTRTPICPYRPSFCPTRTPSSSVGLPARHREFHRAQKWLAPGRTRRGSPTRRHATSTQQRSLGRGSGARRPARLRFGAPTAM